MHHLPLRDLPRIVIQCAQFMQQQRIDHWRLPYVLFVTYNHPGPDISLTIFLNLKPQKYGIVLRHIG